MVKLGVSNSRPLFEALAAGPLDIDYIKVDAEAHMEVMQLALKYKPVLLHDVSGTFWLNYEDPFQEDMTEARAMVDAAQGAWFSTGIGASAEPQGHTTPFWRGADVSQLQTRERVVENIIRNGKQLKEWVGVPLLLENYNYHPTNAYEYICEPALFSELIAAIDCGVLLDLAHAQISAFNMGWESIHKYLEALPLDKVRELHVNHPGREATQMLDRHFPLQEDDLDLILWTLDHTPAEAVTIESEPPDVPTMLHEIEILQHALRNR